jgi:TrmH family RNA methyltransferase
VGFFRAARRDPSLVVLEGFHAVKHAVRFGAELVRLAVVDAEAAARLAAELAPDVASAVGSAEVVPADVFAGLAPRMPPTGVLAVAQRPEVDAAAVLGAGGAPCVLLEDPQDLANAGACVRVAAAAGARGVVMTGSKDPWSPAAVRGSAGLHFACRSRTPTFYAMALPGGGSWRSTPRASRSPAGPLARCSATAPSWPSGPSAVG